MLATPVFSGCPHASLGHRHVFRSRGTCIFGGVARPDCRWPGLTSITVAAPRAQHQLSFADVDGETSLCETTFVVVDLETTGSRAQAGPDGTRDAITEIGAVKVRGGEIIGEFATLVDPQRSIPPQIVELTGIDTVMVRDAPVISAVLPASWTTMDFESLL